MTKRSGKRGSLWRKGMAVALSCLLLADAAPSVGAASDLSGHWAESTIQKWVSEGTIKGYEDGTFRPERPITRAEIAALVNRKFGVAAATRPAAFTDLPSDGWQYAPLAAAVEQGYIKGYEDGSIRPDEPVTRQELAVMLDGIIGLKAGDTLKTFADEAEFPEWSRASIRDVASHGIMGGYEDGTFGPTRRVTRAEAVVSLDRAASAPLAPIVYGEPGVYGPEKGSETIAASVEVTKPGVTLRNLVIRGDLVLGEGIGEGDATLRNVTVQGRTIVKGGGANSIHMEDSALRTIVVEKANGAVRIVASGTTSVDEAEILSAVRIEEENIEGTGFTSVTIGPNVPKGTKITFSGDFDNIVVNAKGALIDVVDGTVEALEVGGGAEAAQILVGNGVVVDQLILAAKADVKGGGRVVNAEVREGASGTTFEKQPEKQTGVGATPPPVAPPAVGGGGGGTVGGGGQPVLQSIAVSITGYKKMEIGFAVAVSPEQTAFEVKNPSGAKVNVTSASYSADRKKATLELVEPLAAGEYEVNVTIGTGTTYSKKVTAENERVVDLAFLLDTVQLVGLGNLRTKFKLTNQYGENVTDRYGDQAYFWVSEKVGTNALNGTNSSWESMEASAVGGVSANSLNSGVASISTNYPIRLNDRFVIRGAYGSMRVKKTLAVAETEIPAVSPGERYEWPYEIYGIYHVNDLPLTTESNFEEYRLLFRHKEGVEPKPEEFYAFQISNIWVKTDRNRPVFEKITLPNGQVWYGMQLLQPHSITSGQKYVILTNLSMAESLVFNVTVEETTNGVVTGAFLVNDRLYAASVIDQSQAIPEWELTGKHTGTVTLATYESRDGRFDTYSIGDGEVPLDEYRMINKAMKLQANVVYVGSEAIGDSRQAKLTYGGTITVNYAINNGPLTPLDGLPHPKPLAVNDRLWVVYGDSWWNEGELFFTAVWDGASWKNEALFQQLAAPAGGFAEAMSATEIRLSWEPVPHAQHYYVYYKNKSGSSYQLLYDAQGNPVVTTETSYIVDSPDNWGKEFAVTAAAGGTDWIIESPLSEWMSLRNESLVLDFKVSDAIADPVLPILYMVDAQGKKLYAVNYETGETRSADLPGIPVRIRQDDGKLFVAVQIGQQYGSETGAIMILDAASLSTVDTIAIQANPIDFALDRFGNAHVSTTRGYEDKLMTYKAGAYQTGPRTIGVSDSYQIEAHPTMDKLYGIPRGFSPSGIWAFPITNGNPTSGRVSNYYGDYPLGSRFEFSPDGKYLFTGGNTVFRVTDSVYSDMTFVHRFPDTDYWGSADYEFDLANDRFYEASGNAVTEYDYSDFEPTGVYPTERGAMFVFQRNDRIIAITKTGEWWNPEQFSIEKPQYVPYSEDESPGIYLSGSVTDAVYDADRGLVYAVDTAFQRLHVVDLKTNALTRTVQLSYKPMGVSLSEDGSKLYIVNRDERALVSELSAEDYTELRILNDTWVNDWGESVDRHVYERGNRLYVITGEWEPAMAVFDSESFAKVSSGSAIQGVGDMAFASDSTKFYYWYQYGWSAGLASSSVREVTVTDDLYGAFAQTDKTVVSYPQFTRDPLDTPVIVLEDRGWVIAKNHIFAMDDLKTTIAVLPEPIYAVSPDGTRLVGKNGVYDAATFQKVHTVSLGKEIFFGPDGTLYHILNNRLLTVELE